jgi:hypothetical protein
MSGVGHFGEHVIGVPVANMAALAALWVIGLAFQEPLYLDLGLEPRRGEAFESFLND